MAPPALDIAPSLKSQAVRRALWLSEEGQELNPAPFPRTPGDPPTTESSQESRHTPPEETVGFED